MASNKVLQLSSGCPLSSENTQSDQHQFLPSFSVSDREQSQRLRSLHQIVELTESFDSAYKRDTCSTIRQHNHAYTTARLTRTHTNSTLAQDRGPTTDTSLLGRNRTGRKYGSSSSAGSFKSFRQNFLRLQPTLLNHFRRRSGTRALSTAAVAGDRRNEFFTLKRLIFMMLGMPNTPAIPTRMQKISTCLAIPFYVAVFIWGVGIFVVALQSDGWIWSGMCPMIIPAKLLTMFSGLFFMLLGLFWLAVLWWSRSARNALPQEFRNFSIIALLWWMLCMYFVGVVIALLVEVYEQRALIATMGNATSDDGWSTSVTCDGGGELEVPNNMLPLWALSSMLALWLLYIGIFLMATITIYII